MSNDERDAAWNKHTRQWLTDTAAVLGEDFSMHEVGCFWIVSNRPERDVQWMGRLLLNARKSILLDLEGLADPGLSPLAVLWLEDHDQYYEYVSGFYPDSGEFSFSGGMFLRMGLPHFVFPHYEEIWQLEHVIAHELTHALVSHLHLPLWLDEGMAVMLEEMIAAGRSFRPEPDILEEHRAFWDAGKIQEFWNGQSFSRPDEGNRLSYSLAQILVANLGHDFARYRQFALAAHWNDGGEAAARQVFHISLGDLIGELLGAGTWAPDPASWKSADARSSEEPASALDAREHEPHVGEHSEQGDRQDDGG